MSKRKKREPVSNVLKPDEQAVKEKPKELIDELRKKNLNTAYQADVLYSRKAEIKLFCLECSGGSKKILRECPTTECPLWIFRLGTPIQRTEEQSNNIPKKEYYVYEIQESITDADREAGKKLCLNKKEK